MKKSKSKSKSKHRKTRGPKDWRYGCVLDAGSSGTRIYIYRWKDHLTQRGKATPEELDSLPMISTKKKWTKKIRPGISTFAENLEGVGPDHLEQLFEHARAIIPADLIPETPLFLLATAGVRLLGEFERRALLKQVCNYAIQHTDFLLPDCSLHVQAITGETEGLYGWIAANYLIGSFDATQKHDHGKNHHTYGFLDMGGASAQIAFVPNATEINKHADDLKLLRMRKLSGESVEYKVFVTTWLGFGVHEARSRYIEKLMEASSGPTVLELPDPCLHAGLTSTLDGKEVGSSSSTDKSIKPANDKNPYLVGTGKFDECQLQVHPLLSDGKVPCNGAACLLDGHHFPKADFDINHFLGVSEYWHTTHEVFEIGHDKHAYDLATYSNRVRDFCSERWEVIKDKLREKELGKKVDADKAMSICFRASWIMSVLHDGIGVPRIGLETSGSGHNATEDLIGGAKEKGFLDPFQPVDDIHNVEVSWTLGKMVLYATSVVPPKTADSDGKNHALPVGFGSNSLSGDPMPADFEEAGVNDGFKTPSHPQPPSLSHPSSGPVSGVPVPGSQRPAVEDDSDHWHGALWNNSNSSRRIPGLIVFLLIFSFASYLLLGRDRRNRLARKLGLQWLCGGRGRRSPTSSSGMVMYERVGEDDLELGGPATPAFFELTDYDEDEAGTGSGGNATDRGVQTNLQIVSQTEFLFSLPAAQSINHIVVFLLPTTQLPPDYAATVYFQWPGRPFQLLGGLSIDKQSAIFRLNLKNHVTVNANANMTGDSMVDDNSIDQGFYQASGEDVTAQLGISVEPIAMVQQKLMSLPAHLSSLSAAPVGAGALVPAGGQAGGSGTVRAGDSTAVLTLARRIIKHAFNYLGSFSAGPPGAEVVPMREFQSWWNKFEHKLSVDASFLEKDEI
ncbi:Guanosine-diphosphatase [Orbilia brochopaga]|nr:Guanosine-diphosphatase [Drechslerella brochopaga]